MWNEGWMAAAAIAVFGLAGCVKGVVGLGLPTVSMALLAVFMPPAQAAALLLLPSLVTNLVHRQEQHAIAEQRQQVMALAESVAASAALWVAARDFAGMQESIGSLSAYPGLRHAILLDTRGEILAHTDRSRRGLFLPLPPANDTSTVLHAQHLALEVAAPIRLQQAHIGWLRIGINNEALAEELRNSRRKAYIYAALAPG